MVIKMTLNLKALRIFASLVAIKAIICLIMSAFGATAVPPFILAGLSALWLLGALMLLWLAHTVEKQGQNFSVTIRLKKKEQAEEGEQNLGLTLK